MGAAVTLLLATTMLLASCTAVPARHADRGQGHRHLSASPSDATAAAAAARVAGLLAADGGGSCVGAATAQTMTGAVTGCIRIPDVRPGQYHVVVEQVLVGTGTKAAGPAPGAPLSPPARASGAPSPPVHLRILTRHARPGGNLVILGTITGSRTPGAASANLCLDGCTSGLVYDGDPVQWMSRTRFTLHIVLPATGWLATSPDRVRTLQPGGNTISLTCLVAGKSCARQPPDAIATFRLAAAPTRCSPGQPCAVLEADPAITTPGQVVAVAGFVPLLSVIGSDQPFVYQLALLPGTGAGTPIRFVPFATSAKSGGASPDASTVELGAAAVRVAPLISLASLGVLHPISTTEAGPSGAGPVTPDPADPSALAWCGPGSLSVTSTGAGPAVSLPTRTARAALEALRTPPPPGIPPQCIAAVPLGPASDPAAVVVAAFPVLPANQTPVVADVALSTSDGGRSWTPAPVPAGALPDSFGGFRVDGGTLLAIFAPPGSRPGAAPLVEATRPPGPPGAPAPRWVASRLGCPTGGPCVTFSAYRPGDCAMNETYQGLLFSPNAGRTWRTPSWPTDVDACSAVELVAIGPRSELLLDPGSRFPVRRSVDGGATWSTAGVPSLPGVAPGAGPTPEDGSLLLLPDGSLLLTGEHGSSSTWELLRPRTTRWCPVANSPRAAATATAFSPVGLLDGQLWWLLSRPGAGQQDAQHVVADALRC